MSGAAEECRAGHEAPRTVCSMAFLDAGFLFERMSLSAVFPWTMVLAFVHGFGLSVDS